MTIRMELHFEKAIVAQSWIVFRSKMIPRKIDDLCMCIVQYKYLTAPLFHSPPPFLSINPITLLFFSFSIILIFLVQVPTY